jgi:hypothetical protein
MSSRLMERPPRPWSRLRWCGAALAIAAAAVGCESENPPLAIRNLDRPSAAAFACYGDLRVNGGDPEAGGDVRSSAQPMSSCLAGEDRPAGQAELDPPAVYGFVLQAARGTIAVIDAATQAVQDSDPLAPGKNAIPIGTLPVGMTADQSGCHMDRQRRQLRPGRARCHLGARSGRGVAHLALLDHQLDPRRER